MYWCSACRAAHEGVRAGLWLEGDPQPPTDPAVLVKADVAASPVVSPMHNSPAPPSSPALARQALNGAGNMNAAPNSLVHPRRGRALGEAEADLGRDELDPPSRRDTGTRMSGP